MFYVLTNVVQTLAPSYYSSLTVFKKKCFIIFKNNIERGRKGERERGKRERERERVSSDSHQFTSQMAATLINLLCPNTSQAYLELLSPFQRTMGIPQYLCLLFSTLSGPLGSIFFLSTMADPLPSCFFGLVNF